MDGYALFPLQVIGFFLVTIGFMYSGRVRVFWVMSGVALFFCVFLWPLFVTADKLLDNKVSSQNIPEECKVAIAEGMVSYQ
ncbi:MAG: hypothetical protein PHP69_05235 [Candidatus Omnitrophica bacterium]|jgi:hypothetical protein|nr:hypothetical protein [Candidatus Omnitrophota bacterium]